MNNPLGILAGIIVCSATLPIFLSVVSYDNIETNTSQKQEQLVETKSSQKYINYETIDKESPKINIYNHKTNKTQYALQNINFRNHLYQSNWQKLLEKMYISVSAFQSLKQPLCFVRNPHQRQHHWHLGQHSNCRS